MISYFNALSAELIQKFSRSKERVDQSRQELSKTRALKRKEALSLETPDHYKANIENYAGEVSLPVGLAGPLLLHGSHIQGEVMVPLATTEATLVASYHRGANLITLAGGAKVCTIETGVTRAPLFKFNSLEEAFSFSEYIFKNKGELKKVAESTSRYIKLSDLRFSLDGRQMILFCDYQTGDAAGQNMVTIATQTLCEYLVKNSPHQPRLWYIESNASGDKKANQMSFTRVRGRKVVAEVELSERLLKKVLRIDVDQALEFWSSSVHGGIISGSIGVCGHFANGLAALFCACGQDIASVAESSVGVNRVEKVGDGLVVSVTLPSLIVGTVGGGTGLPSQTKWLDSMGLAGEGKANAFAEVCAGIALAGEISICGAIAAGEFTQSHEKFARKR